MLSAAERARLAGFRVPKRRADWLIGRIAAKSAVLAALAEVAEVAPGGWPARGVEIASEPSGAPYAVVASDAGPLAGFAPGQRLPIGVSISHAERQALGAATWNGAGPSRRTLGVDLGRVERRSPEFLATFLTEREQRFVRDGPPSERDLRANLVWCAKEAVLKALGVGLTVDTYGLTCLPDPRGGAAAGLRLVPGGGEWTEFAGECDPALVAGGDTIRGLWRMLPGGFVGALAARDVSQSPTEGESAPA